MRKITHDISEKTRSKIVAEIAPVLATNIDLYLQLKHAHWNIRGQNFIALHEMLDAIATSVNGFGDELAERIVQLGGQTEFGTKTSKLKPYPAANTQEAHLKAVRTAISDSVKLTRAAIDVTDEAGDAVTADLCTSIAASLDKHLWFVESHIS